MKRVKLLLMVVVLGALLLLPCAGVALADELDVDIVVVGDDPDVDLEVTGDNPSISINGENIEDIAMRPRSVSDAAYWNQTTIRRTILPWMGEAEGAINTAFNGLAQLIVDLEAFKGSSNQTDILLSGLITEQESTLMSLHQSLKELACQLEEAVVDYQRGIDNLNSSLQASLQDEVSRLNAEISGLEGELETAHAQILGMAFVYNSAIEDLTNGLALAEDRVDTILMWGIVTISLFAIWVSLLVYKVIRR